MFNFADSSGRVGISTSQRVIAHRKHQWLAFFWNALYIQIQLSAEINDHIVDLKKSTTTHLVQN